MARDSASLVYEPIEPTVTDSAQLDEVDMAKDEAPSVESLALAQGRPIGEGLKAARQFLGLTLEDISEVTKIRRQYLMALEAMNIAQLPSRPFVEGYVRAYANMLGVDENRAVARFRQDVPNAEEGLREPAGVANAKDPRIVVVVIAGALVIVAIVVWNIATRAMADREPASSSAIVAAAPITANAQDATVSLGQVLPPPVEATLPPAYVTPGLEPVEPDGPADTAVTTAVTEPPRAFAARGPIYGAAADQSTVTLQAIRNVLLVVKGRDDTVYEARPLQAGEAFRVPSVPGLVIDVSVPSSIEVFISGQFSGQLAQPLTPVGALTRAQ